MANGCTLCCYILRNKLARLSIALMAIPNHTHIENNVNCTVTIIHGHAIKLPNLAGEVKFSFKLMKQTTFYPHLNDSLDLL